jgi:hypothetical protein
MLQLSKKKTIHVSCGAGKNLISFSQREIVALYLSKNVFGTGLALNKVHGIRLDTIMVIFWILLRWCRYSSITFTLLALNV